MGPSHSHRAKVGATLTPAADRLYDDGVVQLTCKRCGAALHARDVDFDALRASCRACGWQVGGMQQGAYRERGEERRTPVLNEDEPPRVPLPPLPHNVAIVEAPQGAVERLVVEIRPERIWRMVLVVSILVLQGASYVALRGMPVVLAVVLGVVVTWISGAFMGNRRILTVERGQLQVSFWPFPRPSKTIDVTELDQLWVDEYSYRGDVTYRLLARTKGGKKVVLVDQLTQPTGALHLERRIEELLGIVDKPVSGEVPRLGARGS